jgi:hypothetical protein
MAHTRTPAADRLTAACPDAARTRAGLPRTLNPREVERALLTHALHCPVCGPLADRHRQEQSARIAGLAEQARVEAARGAVPVLEAAAKIIEANGWCRTYLWDTRQHHAGTPIEHCRVDIAGALATALHGSPAYAGTPAVRAVEALLVARIAAPSLAAWYTQARPSQQDAVDLLRATADHHR